MIRIIIKRDVCVDEKDIRTCGIRQNNGQFFFPFAENLSFFSKPSVAVFVDISSLYFKSCFL
jgi:hypothetical protein